MSSLIKNECAIMSPTFFFSAQGHISHNSEVNRWMWPEFDLVQDLMVVLITCKFNDNLIIQRTNGPVSIAHLSAEDMLN